MTSWRGTRPAVATGLVVLILAGIAVASFAHLAHRPGPYVKFCTMGLYAGGSGSVHMRTEDQGAPGRDGCDPQTADEPYLGFDCVVHYPDDWPGERITAPAEPNRPDGTCGQPDRPY